MDTKISMAFGGFCLCLAACSAPTESINVTDIRTQSHVFESVQARSIDSSGDGLLSPGEVVWPECEFDFKPNCSKDAFVIWKAEFLDDRGDGNGPVAWPDLNGEPMFGEFRTDLHCVDHEFVVGETRPINGAYADVIMNPPGNTAIACGYTVTSFEVFNTDSGDLLEHFTEDALDELGLDLLPVVN